MKTHLELMRRIYDFCIKVCWHTLLCAAKTLYYVEVQARQSDAEI